MICFVIAMEKEAAPIIRLMKVKSDKKINGKRVVTGKLFGKKAGLVVCGVGKVNAGSGTQYAIDKLKADPVVNIGVAGGLRADLKVADIYAISRAVQYDFDLTQLNNTRLGTLDECTENYLSLAARTAYPMKRLATGDRFNDSAEDYEILTSTLSADVRDMEGGAIAQVCMHAGVTCRAYKIISDLYGSGSTTAQYLKNLSACFDTLERELKNIMEEL